MINLMKRLDLYAITIGVVAIVTNVFIPADSLSESVAYVTCILAALMGLIYIFYPVYLYLCRRADFDWHLINGHFMRKVCCLVILAPFVLTIVGNCFFVDNPKELVQQEELYDCAHAEIPCEIRKHQESPNMFWATYFHFIDPGNQHMTTSRSGRAWAMIVGIIGVFLLGGLLVSSIIGWIDKRKEAWQNGTIRYGIRDLGKYRFAVVIGANEIASSVIRNLFTPKSPREINYKCEGDNRYVVLHTSRKAEDVRAELSAHLTEEEMKRIIIYNGLRDSASELVKMHLRYATEIYVLGESTLLDGGETYHDSLNMRCANLIASDLDVSKTEREDEKKMTGRSVRKVCKVMFEYQTTSSIFQFSDISDKIKENLVFIPFNRYESWARKVIVEGAYGEISYTPLEGTGITESSSEFVHLVIVGMSRMGVAMGLEALLQAHYLNSEKARTRITFVDANMDKEMAFFKGRYANMFELVRTRYMDAQGLAENVDYDAEWHDPMMQDGCRWKHLSEDGKNFLDVEIEFIKGEVESEGVRKCLREMAEDINAKLTVAVCLTQTHQAIAACLYLPLEVYRSERLQQVWVHQPESEDILSNISTMGSDLRYEKIRPFGMLYGEYMNDRSLYLKAMLVNVAYDIANGYNKEGWPQDISDKCDKGYEAARSEWKGLTVDKRWSNKYFADSMYIKIRNIMAHDVSFGSYAGVKSLLAYDLDGTVAQISKALCRHRNSLAVCEHNRWMIQQLLLGYSPCDRVLDKIFEELQNGAINEQQAREKYAKWKYTNLRTSEIHCRKIKDDVKACSLRIHPNICCMRHLVKIDAGAEKYDVDLNESIPRILSIIDGYRS